MIIKNIVCKVTFFYYYGKFLLVEIKIPLVRLKEINELR